MKIKFTILALFASVVVVLAQTKFATSIQVPAISVTNGPAAIGQILTATSTGGASAWSNAPSGSTSTNLVTLSSGSITMGGATITNGVTAATATISTLLSLGSGVPLLWSSLGRIVTATDGMLTMMNAAQNNYFALRLGGTTAAFPAIGRTNGDLIVFGADAAYDGTSTNRLLVPGGIVVGATGQGSIITLYDTAGTNFEIRTPTMSSNIMYRWPKNETPGVMIAQNESGTNQMTNITLTAGQYVTYNGTAYVASNAPTVFEMPVSGLASNVSKIIYKMHSGSVLGANSNQTIWLGQTNVSDLLVSTNVTFTNFNGITVGNSASFTAFMKVTNAAANVGVNWGNLGGSNPGYAIAIWTNANSPMWTTLTNTKTYVLSVTSRGTNLHPTLTLWE